MSVLSHEERNQLSKDVKILSWHLSEDLVNIQAEQAVQPPEIISCKAILDAIDQSRQKKEQDLL